ncbi:ExeA family protein [Humidesulfovibrio sp.]
MSHYAGAGLEREPFSNSPDPSFLLGTRQHATCLQELEISLRLRRGLNLVTGDIGTGKTTLCRSLLRAFAEDEGTDVHLLLDPHFDTSEEFLRVILASVTGQSPEPGMGLWALKETLKQQLFRLGLVEKRLVVLIIDEGQKISTENLEILRELLNYETNTSKLLQIVIFGQRELEPLVDAMPNLADRINVRRRLSPLSYAETKRMIAHRLAVAAGGGSPAARFSPLATLAIHLASGGSPRKTVRLCHMALLEMLVRGKNCVGLAEVRRCARPDGGNRLQPRRAMGLAALTAICVSFGGLWLSLGGSGPVLGPAAGQRAVQTGSVPAGAAEPATNLSAKGLSLGQDQLKGLDQSQGQTGRDLAAKAAADREAPPRAAAQGLTERVSLLPQRDQGPVMREAVQPPRPELPQAQQPSQEPMLQPGEQPAASPASLALAANPVTRQASLGQQRQ